MNRQQNSGGGGGMFIMLGIGLLAYWYISKGGLSSLLGTTTTTTPTTGTTGGGTTPTHTGTTTPPAPAYNSIASIYSRMLSASGNNASQLLSPDQWNYYLVTQSSIPAGPDPIAVFGNHDPMTLSTYWAGMQSWLTGQGLSGLGRYRGWAA